MPDHSTIWRWIHAEEEFRDRYARAIQTRAINHAEEISETIQQVKRGEIPPDVGRVVVDGMKWVASRLLPKVYGDKQIVEANVTHTHQLHLDALRALSARRSGNDLGYIEAQAIDITNDQTFSGERMDTDLPAIVDGSDVNRIDVNDLDPPVPPRAGGRLRRHLPLSIRTKTDRTPHPHPARSANLARRKIKNDDQLVPIRQTC